MLGVSESLFWPSFERTGVGWALLPDCGAWGHALGALFPPLSLSGLLLIKSSWVCGVDYQLVPDLLTGSHYVPLYSA